MSLGRGGGVELVISSRLQRAGNLQSNKKRGVGGAAPPFAELPNYSGLIVFNPAKRFRMGQFPAISGTSGGGLGFG